MKFRKILFSMILFVEQVDLWIVVMMQIMYWD